MAASVAWARAFAAELVERGLRLQPDPPHTNTFRAFADGDADAITERVVEFMEKEKVVLVRRLVGRRAHRAWRGPR